MKPSLIIAGLGNHGPSYAKTRHNAGYWAVDQISEKYGEGDWQNKQKFDALVQEARIVTVPVLLVKPQTYMNLSGQSLKKVIDFYKLDPVGQLLVMCDDVDLALGEYRLRMKGGPGTHNGLKSIVEIFGEEFPRFRIGLGAQPTGMDLSAWVLSAPSEEEKEKIDEALKDVPERIKEFVLD